MSRFDHLRYMYKCKSCGNYFFEGEDENVEEKGICTKCMDGLDGDVMFRLYDDVFPFGRK